MTPPTQLAVAPRARSPRGTALWMTLGTVTVGLSGYVFLSVIGHDRFSSAMVAALTSTYLLTNIVGPGVFASIEQETSRAISDRIARGWATRRTVHRIAGVTAALTVSASAVLAVAAPTLLDRVLESDAGLLAAVAISVAGSAAVFLVRGVAAGHGRFDRYAATLLIDGGVRLSCVLALVLAGDRTPAAYALSLAAGPVTAAVVVALSLIRDQRQPSRPVADADTAPLAWSTVTRSVTLLMSSSVLAYGISNLSPVVVTAAVPEAPLVAAGFAVGLVITRIPLLLMAPVQAMMLPRMTRAAARHDVTALRRDLVRGLAAVAAFGVVLVVGTAVIGRAVIGLLFGRSLDTTGVGVLSLLALSATLLIAIQWVQPALVALRRPGGLILGWVIGTTGFLTALFVLPVPALAAAVTAQLVGPAVALGVHLAAVRSGLRQQRSATV